MKSCEDLSELGCCDFCGSWYHTENLCCLRRAEYLMYHEPYNKMTLVGTGVFLAAGSPNGERKVVSTYNDMEVFDAINHHSFVRWVHLGLFRVPETDHA